VKAWIALAAAAVAFGLVATANSGGYRFGVSDQAYYEPAVAKIVDPTLFPRDSGLLDVQSKFLGSVHLLGALVRWTGATLPSVFAVTYAITLAGLFAASVMLARRLGLSWWAVAGFLVLLTLRHRIAKTGANSLEGYMHPRMLAFVCGVAASAALVRGRIGWTAAWTALAALMHPTTALWFLLLEVAALFVARPAWRRPLILGVTIGVAVGIWLLITGPLAGRVRIMDAEWLSVLADKDYLFPSGWPAYAWLINLAYPIVIWLVFKQRQRSSAAVPGESALVAGMLALVAIFLLSVPFSSARVALAVQLQVNRVFWLTDFFAAAYAAWWLIDRRRDPRVRAALVVVLAVVALVRGVYVLRVETDRRLAQWTLPDTTWVEALVWLRTQPETWQVLADPGHAWKNGVSVRVGAHRDTFLEMGKDASMAMYDRAVAVRVQERTAALGDFAAIDSAGARSVGARFHLDVMIDQTTRALDLPVLYRNADFVIYGLR